MLKHRFLPSDPFLSSTGIYLVRFIEHRRLLLQRSDETSARWGLIDSLRIRYRRRYIAMLEPFHFQLGQEKVTLLDELPRKYKFHSDFPLARAVPGSLFRSAECKENVRSIMHTSTKGDDITGRSSTLRHPFAPYRIISAGPNHSFPATLLRIVRPRAPWSQSNNLSHEILFAFDEPAGNMKKSRSIVRAERCENNRLRFTQSHRLYFTLIRGADGLSQRRECLNDAKRSF